MMKMELIIGDKISLYCSSVGLACRIGDLERLKTLLKEGAPVDNPDNRGWFPIHEAAFENHVSCLQALFDTRPDRLNVNWRSHDGSTALVVAAHRGNLEATIFLLEKGADPNLGSKDELKPILAAVKSNSQLCVEALLNAEADVSSPYWNMWTPLHEATSKGYLYIVQLLLSKGADPFDSDEEGLTPAFVACQYNWPDCLEMLLENVQDKTMLVNGCTKDGVSCVFIACQESHYQCLDILLTNEADVNVCTNRNVHPVCAAAKSVIQVVELLLPFVDMDVVLHSAEDPVFIAVEFGDVRMVESLLEAGFPCDRLTPDYFDNFAVPIYNYLQPLLTKTSVTPLSCAVSKCKLDMVRLLLDRGAAVVPTDRQSHSPLLLAVLKRREPNILIEILKATRELNGRSCNSVYNVPDALLVALHPFYRCQLMTMLKAGLDPSLRHWCACQQQVPSELHNRCLLSDLSRIMAPNELSDLVSVLVPFSAVELPNCCQAWRRPVRLLDQEEESCYGKPPSLQHICRISIRSCIPTNHLVLDDWTDSLTCPALLRDYLAYKEM